MMQALSAGAVAIVPKPKAGLRGHPLEEADDIVSVVRSAVQARLKRVAPATAAYPAPAPAKLTADAVLPAAARAAPRAMAETTDRVVALGTPTVGTQALELVLTRLPVDAPGIVIVQHMPPNFTAAFASRLNSICQIEAGMGDDGVRGMKELNDAGARTLGQDEDSCVA